MREALRYIHRVTKGAEADSSPLWNRMFLTDQRFAPDPAQFAAVNRSPIRSPLSATVPTATGRVQAAGSDGHGRNLAGDAGGRLVQGDRAALRRRG
jgi:hypothetical protein